MPTAVIRGRRYSPHFPDDKRKLLEIRMQSLYVSPDLSDSKDVLCTIPKNLNQKALTELTSGATKWPVKGDS